MMMTRTEVPFTGTRTWIGFALIALGMFMAILDIQVVATSLPRSRALLQFLLRR